MTKANTGNQNKTITIIGAGLGGLAASCRLAKLGYKVTIIEQSDQVGGKASELIMDGFRFDRGPSFMTMIDVFEDLFDFCGVQLSDYIGFNPLDLTVAYHWPDRSSFCSYQDVNKTIDLLCSELGEDKIKIQNYLAKIKQVYEISKPFALDNPIEISKIFEPSFLLSGLKFLGLGIGGNLASLHTKIFDNPKTRSIFDRWAAYVYSDPAKMPAILSSIGWAEIGLGLYLPTDGIYGISRGIGRLARELGVKIIFGTKVVDIDQNVNKTWNITTIKQSGRMDYLIADILISNLDIRTTHKNLLNKPYPNQKKSGGSYLIYYWGVKYHPKLINLQLHNIYFGDNSHSELGSRAEFVEQFDMDKVATNPMVYLNITSQLIEKDSPSINGQKAQNWICILSTPPDNGIINWSKEVIEKKNYILDTISSQYNMSKVELNALIVCQKVMTPPDIQDWTGSYNGDLAGCRIESIWDILTRPAIVSKDYDNLYFVGGSINPGPGMPMVLLSAKHCVEVISKSQSKSLRG